MNSSADAAYRLELARGYLKESEDALNVERWWACVASAQIAIENAGKTMIACFEPVEKVHAVSPQLKDLLKQTRLDADLKNEIAQHLTIFARYGAAEHIRTTYGDDKTHTPPWRMYQEEDARRAIADAQTVVQLAQKMIQRYFGST
jgi:HEPN domain-containing protein